MKNKAKTIITYGTFDLLHYGHLEILRRARQLGSELIVGLSTDAFNEVKDKKCFFSYEKRKEMLESIKYVDQIIPEDGWIQKRQDIKNNKVDIFVMGDDWSGKFDDLSDLCEVLYLSRTMGVSTTELKLIMDK
jgi:glycerol-3-phosphate cytidylyltransferase